LGHAFDTVGSIGMWQAGGVILWLYLGFSFSLTPLVLLSSFAIFKVTCSVMALSY
jgi:hypothetical protein